MMEGKGLGSLQPYNCTFCGVSVSWAVVRQHEGRCVMNPANRCSFCRRPCVDPSPDSKSDCLQQRRKHEISCRFHPRNLSEVEVAAVVNLKTSMSAKAATRLRESLVDRDYECLHCRKILPGHMLGQHERNCLENPINHCQHCGIKFEGAGSVTALQRVQYHKSLCRDIPANSATCSFCDRQYFSSSQCSAKSALKHHEVLCPENPKSKCQYCSKAFRPFGRVPLESILAQHKRICPNRRDNVVNCRYCDKEYRSTTTTSARVLRRRHEEICPSASGERGAEAFLRLKDTRYSDDKPNHMFQCATRLRRAPRDSGVSSPISSSASYGDDDSSSSSSSSDTSSTSDGEYYDHRPKQNRKSFRFTDLPTFSDSRRTMSATGRYPYYGGVDMRSPHGAVSYMQDELPTGGCTWRSSNEYIRISDEKRTNETTIFDVFMRRDDDCSRVSEVSAGSPVGVDCRNPLHHCTYNSMLYGSSGGRPVAAGGGGHCVHCVGPPLNTRSVTSGVYETGIVDPRDTDSHNGGDTIQQAADLEVRAIRARLSLIERSNIEEARQEVRRLQLQWHPDKAGDDPVRVRIASLVYPAVQDMWKRFA